MNKEETIKIIKKKVKGNSKRIMINQVEKYYNASDYIIHKHNYTKGDKVFLKKGTLLHGTYKNIEGLKEIVDKGLIASSFTTNGRLSKYPSSVGVWNLKQDYLLKDYINFYSGGTIKYYGVIENDVDTQTNKTDVIQYDKMNRIIDITSKIKCHKWELEETKEARFMPSLVQDIVQIGIIFNAGNEYIQELLKGDILNPNNIKDKDVKPFVNPNYYKYFVIDRKNKDDFFTDRESAILFGIPSNFIEGVLVGRTYEKEKSILKEIKDLLPNAYICNLDGKVIVD